MNTRSRSTSPPTFHNNPATSLSSHEPQTETSSSTTTTSTSTSSLTWVNVYTPQHLAGASACNGEGHLMIHSSHRLSTTYVDKCDKEKLVRVQKKGNCFMSDWQITKPTPIRKQHKTASTTTTTTTKKRMTIHMGADFALATPAPAPAQPFDPCLHFQQQQQQLLHEVQQHSNALQTTHQVYVSPQHCATSRKQVEIKSLVHDCNKTVSSQDCFEIMAAALRLNSKSVIPADASFHSSFSSAAAS